MSIHVITNDHERTVQCEVVVFREGQSLSQSGDVVSIKSNRVYGEPVSNALKRISLAIQKKICPPVKRRKKQSVEGANPSPSTPKPFKLTLLDAQGESIPESDPVEVAFLRTSRASLDDYFMNVACNGPVVEKVLIHHPRVNILTTPILHVLNCCPLDIVIKWFKIDDDDKETFLHEGRFFRPDISLKGRRLDIKAFHPDLPHHVTLGCSPSRILPSIGHISDKHIERLERFRNSKTSEKSISLLCYNILADAYARTPQAQELSFPYCSREALDWQYRRGLILDELRTSDADIIALQECTASAARGMLSSHSIEYGYQGRFKAKLGRVREGELLLYKSNRFQLLGDFSIPFKDLVVDLGDQTLLNLWNRLFPSFFDDDLQHLSTIFQVVLLRDVQDGNKPLLVANTHLFFHPRAAHTRLLQVHVLYSYIHRLSHYYAERHATMTPLEQKSIIAMDYSETDLPPQRKQLFAETEASSLTPIPIITMGDFNSTQGSLAATYLKNNLTPPASTWCREYSCTHTFKKDEEQENEEESGAEGGHVEESNDPRHGGKAESRHKGDTRAKDLRKELAYTVTLPSWEEYDLDLDKVILKNPLGETYQSDLYYHHQQEHLPEREHLTWTNRVNGFCEQLDYLGASDAFVIEGLLGCPQDEEDLDAKGIPGIPCPMYPSDHICIGAVVSRKIS